MPSGSTVTMWSRDALAVSAGPRDAQGRRRLSSAGCLAASSTVWQHAKQCQGRRRRLGGGSTGIGVAGGGAPAASPWPAHRRQPATRQRGPSAASSTSRQAAHAPAARGSGASPRPRRSHHHSRRNRQQAQCGAASRRRTRGVRVQGQRADARPGGLHVGPAHLRSRAAGGRVGRRPGIRGRAPQHGGAAHLRRACAARRAAVCARPRVRARRRAAWQRDARAGTQLQCALSRMSRSLALTVRWMAPQRLDAPPHQLTSEHTSGSHQRSPHLDGQVVGGGGHGF